MKPSSNHTAGQISTSERDPLAAKRSESNGAAGNSTAMPVEEIFAPDHRPHGKWVTRYPNEMRNSGHLKHLRKKLVSRHRAVQKCVLKTVELVKLAGETAIELMEHVGHGHRKKEKAAICEEMGIAVRTLDLYMDIAAHWHLFQALPAEVFEDLTLRQARALLQQQRRDNESTLRVVDLSRGEGGATASKEVEDARALRPETMPLRSARDVNGWHSEVAQNGETEPETFQNENQFDDDRIAEHMKKNVRRGLLSGPVASSVTRQSAQPEDFAAVRSTDAADKQAEFHEPSPSSRVHSSAPADVDLEATRIGITNLFSKPRLLSVYNRLNDLTERFPTLLVDCWGILASTTEAQFSRNDLGCLSVTRVALEDSHLYISAPHDRVADACWLMERWGFTLVTSLAVTGKLFPGTHCRGPVNHYFVLIGSRGERPLVPSSTCSVVEGNCDDGWKIRMRIRESSASPYLQILGEAHDPSYRGKNDEDWQVIC